VADAHGLSIRATMADQAASAAALLPAEADDALVNLGTGAFVLRPGGTGARRPGYLTGPFDVRDGIVRCAVEGAINGAGAAVDRFGAGPTPVPDSDPSPDAFCLPDRGAGSPYWLPALGPSWSQAARDANADARRRIALEGLIFRVRQVLEGLAPSPPRRVLIAGGLAREPFAGAGIAALLERPVELLRTRESGLLGAARIAAGLAPFADPEVVRITPGDAGRYLPRKYPRWLEWVETQARAAQTSSAS
jgi:glycerol kinase